jgi:hypothetical protein
MKRDLKKGDVFGKLTVLYEAEKFILPSGQTNRAFMCRCECGNEKVIRLLHLVRGRISSCGCIQGEHHGECKSLLYNVWRGMKNRCDSDTYINHNRYKDRGITVCDEWNKSYLTFKAWASANGWMEGLELDRKNNDGNYEPSNCRFVTPIVNANNKEATVMVFYDGKEQPFLPLLRELNIPELHHSTIRTRMQRGWSFMEAITIPIDRYPIRKGKISITQKKELSQRFINGEDANSLAREYGVSSRMVWTYVGQYKAGYFDKAIIV